MSLIVPLIYLLFFTFFLTSIFEERFLKCLPFSFIISSLVLFMSQMIFKTFYPGIFICVGISFSFIVYMIVKKKKFKDYFTKDVYAFILIYLLIFAVDFNRSFYKWDELSHWGKMVKEMFRLDSFYSVSPSNLLVHKDYPPIMSILEYFYAVLCGGYKEAYLIRGVHLFESSLILSTISYDKDKKKWLIIKTILAFIISIFVIELFDQSFTFNTIYIDIPLSIFVAYNLYNVYTCDKFDMLFFIKLALCLSFMLLFKQVALAFYLLILFFVILMIFKNKKKVDKKHLLFLLTPVIFFISWSLYVKELGINGQFNIGDIKLTSSFENYQITTISNFFESVLTTNLTNSFISLTYIHFIILIPLLCLITIKDKKEIVKRNKLMFTLILGLIGYMALMLVLYVFCFDEVEAVELASFDRYMNIYTLMVLFTLLFIKFDSILNEKYLKKIIISILILGLIITPMSFIYIRPHLMILNNRYYDSYKESASYIDSKLDAKDKVFIIDQVEAHGSVYFINYYLDKVRTNETNIKLETNLSEDEINDYYYSLLSDYDYIYTFMLDDDFISTYNEISDEELIEKQLYKIRKSNGKLHFQLEG